MRKPIGRLLLVGGGHSHLFVLEAFAKRPEADLDLTLVSPTPLSTYSGMIPGVIAGQYALRAAQIDLVPLAARAGAHFVPARVVRLDPAARQVELDDRTQLAYDLVSFDIGSRTAVAVPVPVDARVVAIKPVEAALQAIDAALATIPSSRIVVIGAGAGGTEIALALAARVREAGGAVALCDRTARPLIAFGARAAALAEQALAMANVQWIGSVTPVAIDRSGVRLQGGDLLPADFVVGATGAVGPPLFAAAGLPVDGRGFLRVDEQLRCVAEPRVFAAGDCATLAAYPDLPKAGVYAVRQGPLLAHNLRAILRGIPQRPFRPRPRTLALLNTADGRAILTYGTLAWRGRVAWRLKDWIDRRFVARFTLQ